MTPKRFSEVKLIYELVYAGHMRALSDSQFRETLQFFFVHGMSP